MRLDKKISAHAVTKLNLCRRGFDDVAFMLYKKDYDEIVEGKDFKFTLNDVLALFPDDITVNQLQGGYIETVAYKDMERIVGWFSLSLSVGALIERLTGGSEGGSYSDHTVRYLKQYREEKACTLQKQTNQL